MLCETDIYNENGTGKVIKKGLKTVSSLHGPTKSI